MNSYAPGTDAAGRTRDLLHRTPQLKEELLAAARRGALQDLDDATISADELAAFVEGRRHGPFESRGGPDMPRDRALEAVVRRFGRPVLLVQNGTYADPASATLAQQLLPHRLGIEKVIARVGRVEFLNHTVPWGGTGWLVDKNIVVTNRHVAEIVAESNGIGGFRFRISPAGVRFGARLDFREEFQQPVGPCREVFLKRIRFLARSDQPDIALLEIDPDGSLPDPLPLLESSVEDEQEIGVIGYPAYDSRSDPADVARYFGDIFDVKRFAPGVITQAPGHQHFFMHDATTLGGNSGSIVMDLASGNPVGLHFAGTYLVGNYAVTAEQIKKALKGLTAMVAVPASFGSTAERKDSTHQASHFTRRRGYSPSFLGKGVLEVPLPGISRWCEDAATVTGANGRTGKVLQYTHFSVVYSTSRRMPIFTAVNIDGSKARKIKRGDDQWFFDLRIPREIQLDQDAYHHQEIDRGHMVRREDPNWGSARVARVANDDTFHYTNAAPQHARLNQGRAQWLGLEEYVLSNAKTHGFSVSVFTGPVLREDDPSLDNGIQVPQEFWKVVVAIDDASRALRSTGYVLSQGKFIEDITETFVYGDYRTYQVPVQKIEDVTGLEFGVLVAADAMSQRGIDESVPGLPTIIPLDRLDDMAL